MSSINISHRGSVSGPSSSPRDETETATDTQDHFVTGSHVGSVVPGRPSNACLRCKGRKTKCSCDRPKCATCIKANVECEYPAVVSSRPTWDYVRQLEARLSAQDRGKEGSHPRADGSPSSSPKRGRPNHASHRESPRSIVPSRAAPILTTAVSSSYNLEVHRPYPFSSIDQSDTLPLGPPSISQLLECLPRDAQLEAISIESIRPANPGTSALYPSFDRSTLPSIEVIEGLVAYYLTYCYSGYLLVHAPTLRQEIEAVLTADIPEARDLYIVFMVLAIASTSQARGLPNSSDLRRQAFFYWDQAQPHFKAAVLRSGLGKLQAIHLMLQFVLHNPESGNIWDLTGSTIRVAIDLGLHHENQMTESRMLSPLDQDLRRKLFWATYCIDRNLSIALGRPPGIPDEWINTRFPSPFSDENITEDGIEDGPPDRKKEGAIHHARLRILQSKIHHRLYTVVASQSSPPSTDWFASMERDIESWQQAYDPDPTGFTNSDWMNLQYHVTRTLLYRPTPGNRTPTRAQLTIALHSSSFIMRLYRDMWRRRNINYIWQAIHHLFLSGVTYLNSLWIASRYGWDLVPSFVDAMLDIQACSSCLEAMTMHEHGTTAIRDAFETVSAAVIRRLSAERMAFTSASTDARISTTAPEILNETRGLSSSSTDPTLPAMDFTRLLDPSRPASPVALTEDQADSLLDSLLLHPFVGLDQIMGSSR